MTARVATLDLAAPHRARGWAIAVKGAASLWRLQRVLGTTYEFDTEDHTDLRPGVYHATTEAGEDMFFEVHQDGRLPQRDVLWTSSDRGVAEASCRGRAQLDVMPAATERRP